MKNFIISELLKPSALHLLLQESSSSSSSSDEEDYSVYQPKVKQIKYTNYFEEVVANYSESEFKAQFRMTRSSVKKLCDELYTKRRFPKEKAVHLTLMFLGSKETIRQISNKFTVSINLCYDFITTIIKAIVEVSSKFIVFPKTSEYAAIAGKFEAKQKLPFVIGAIDSSYIRVDNCSNERSLDKLLMQGVVNYNKIFTDFYVCKSETDKATVLFRSPLFDKLTNNPNFFENYYLVGDSSYPESVSWIVSPYFDNGALTNMQKDFNFKITSTGKVIKNAFRSLKCRFKRLNHFKSKNIDFVMNCTVSAAVLHNLCIFWQDSGREFEREMEDIATDIEEQKCTSPEHKRREEIFNILFS